MARAAGADIDCRRDHPYAAYDRVEFDVITERGGDVWSRVLVRSQEVFESIRIIRQCLEKMEDGSDPTADSRTSCLSGRMGLSSIEAPRGESHHFVITGENNRPRRWRVRAPTYQNLQAVPAMIKDQQIADMTISLGSIDPCFSCTDRLETIDLRSGTVQGLVAAGVVESDADKEGLGPDMKLPLIWAIVGVMLNVGLVLLVAPLFQGILRKVTARIQSRQGPPIRQPYFDLLKLLGKEDIESGETPSMQRFAAYLSLAAVLTVACLVPMGFGAPLNGVGDGILLIYLLTLCGICTLLAGLAAGSTYSLVGISREMMSMIVLEPLFAIAVVVGAMHAQSFRLDTVLHGSVYAPADFRGQGCIMLGVILLSFQALVQRVPFDISEAETELMEGPLMEYSGPKLALFKYAFMTKLIVYSGLFVALFVPWGSGLAFPLGWLLFWVKVSALVLLVTVVAATHARYRIDQAIRFFAGLLAVALVALVLASYGH